MGVRSGDSIHATPDTLSGSRETKKAFSDRLI